MDLEKENLNSDQDTQSSADPYIPVPLESVPLDATLMFPLYIKINKNFVLFRPQGDKISRSRILKLSEKIDVVYTTRGAWNEYVHVVEAQAEELKTTKSCDSEEAISKFRQVLLAYAREFEEKREVKRDMLWKVRELCFVLGENIYKDPQLGLKLVRRYGSPDLHFANHMINSAVYSATIGTKFGLTLSEVKHLTFAAMVHDVGKLFLPLAVTNKATPLNNMEQALLQNHTKLGGDYLDKVMDLAEYGLTASQHHEQMDGEGFPNGLRSEHIHIFAKICAIADVFDSLTTARPYRPVPFIPKVAIEMMRHMRNRFDPSILPSEEDL